MDRVLILYALYILNITLFIVLVPFKELYPHLPLFWTDQVKQSGKYLLGSLLLVYLILLVMLLLTLL